MSEATNERAGKGGERNNEWEIRFKRVENVTTETANNKTTVIFEDEEYMIIGLLFLGVDIVFCFFSVCFDRIFRLAPEATGFPRQ
jgi:hypothetical protein